MDVLRAPRHWASLVPLILIPWAAAAALGCVWTAIRVHPFDGFLPILVAGAAAIAVLAAPMPKRARIAAALVLGIAIRWLAADSLVGPNSVGDTIYNERLAANLLAGNGLTVDVPGYGTDLRAMYPPVYVLALAAVNGLGGSAAVLNLMADSAASAALYRLSGGNERVAAAYFLFPSVVLASIVPLKEALAIALTLIAMCLVKGRSPSALLRASSD